jgi:copper transport protein
LLGLLPAHPAAAEQTRTSTVADLVVTISATPNTPGLNAFTVLAASSRRPPPAPLDGVTLRLTSGSGTADVRLTEAEPGRYVGTGRIGGGPLRLSAILQRPGRRLAVTVSWAVPAATSEPVTVPVARQPRASGGQGPPAPYRDVVGAWLLAAALVLGARRLPAGLRWLRTAPSTPPTIRGAAPGPR